MNLKQTLKALQELCLLEVDALIPICTELLPDGTIKLEVNPNDYNSTLHIKLKLKEVTKP